VYHEESKRTNKSEGDRAHQKSADGELLHALQRNQAEFGYLSKEALRQISQDMEIPESQVYGVATFYKGFRFTPPAKCPIRVCMGTACHLAGGRLILQALLRELQTDLGNVTADGKFSVDRVCCLGCCVLAPVTVFGEVLHGRIAISQIKEVLDKLNDEL
jgi:NADH-quinone oxidoreductase subunit E